MSKKPLEQLSDLGQSVWIDSLSRDMIEGGELERLMHEDAVVGVTSNPSIFQKALASRRRLRRRDARGDGARVRPKEVFFALA